MKILMATMGLDIGGAETHIVELAKELKAEGHDVAIASNGGVYVPEIKAAGIRHYSVPMHRRNVGYMRRSRKLLKEIIQKEKPDVVHAHARIPAFLCGSLHATMHFPFVTTAHWVFETRGMLRYLTNWGQRTVAVSEDIKAYLMREYGVPEEHITVTVNGVQVVFDQPPIAENNRVLVPVRAIFEAMGAEVTWNQASMTAFAVRGDTTVAIQIGNRTMYRGQTAVNLDVPAKALNGRTLVPVRVLADALGAAVDWNSTTGTVTVTSGGSAPTEADVYDPDAVRWLSQIISAESRGEPLLGKIAVGNVVLNRVDHAEFPATIYGVIFDDRWGGQFEPVRNGTVYQTPTSESVIAAKLVLEGADVAQDSLYFLAPTLTDNHWIMENRDYVMTIGVHHFYR